MAEQTVLPPPTMPPEVRAFAFAKDAGPYLPAVIDLTRRVFPSSELAVSLGEDAEDETHRYVALDVEVSGLDINELLAAQRAWSAGLVSICPSRYAIYFVLGWR